jgi:hypothetical protein
MSEAEKICWQGWNTSGRPGPWSLTHRLVNEAISLDDFRAGRVRVKCGARPVRDPFRIEMGRLANGNDHCSRCFPEDPVAQVRRRLP